MNLIKTALAAAIASLAFSASAMTAIADSELGQVTGQDGVSIVADINMNIGSFQYTDVGGGSVAFNDIGITGMMVMTVDVLSGAQFQAAATNSLLAHGLAAANVATVLGATAAATGFVGNDVVQFAFPNVGGAVARAVAPTITVGSITTGNGGASFGSFALNRIDLQGTQIWMYGH